MKIVKQITGTVKLKQIPPIHKRKCPSCQTTGEYDTDTNLNIYCKKCGLIIETPYPYTAGTKHDTYCDFKYQTKLCELKKKWKKTKNKS